MIIPVAILNGSIREKLLIPLLGERIALPFSGISLCILIFLISFAFIPKLGQGTEKTYWIIGGLWGGLAFLFETVLGLATGKTIEDLLSAYDLTTGNLWTIILLFTVIVPRLIARFRYLT